MDQATQTLFKSLESADKNEQYEAFNKIIASIKEEVDWAYEVWDEFIDGLTSPDNHRRSRCAQFLCNLAISDPDKRMLQDLPKIWAVTWDEKFVTARHTLQTIWRVGLAGFDQKEMLVERLVDRFENCMDEKNYTLIRNDILQGLRNLYDETKEESLKEIALGLIEKVEDPKYKKKYAAIWKKE